MNMINKEKPEAASQAVVLFIVSVVQFLNPFMASGVGIALPAIGRDFGSGAVHLGLIEMTYLLSLTILLLPAGRFADIYGRKKVFISGITVFTLSTLVLAFSGSITSFIIIRFVQGTGAALITSTSIAILTSVFPGKGRGPAMGIATASVYLGVSLGPTLAGIIITHFGWRWIFIIPFVFQSAALYMAITKLKGEWADSAGERFDIKGSVIFSLSLLTAIYGILKISESSHALPVLCLGIGGMIFFWFVERNTEHPLLDFNLLRSNRVFTFSNMATMINYAASFGVTFLLSIYLQSVRNFTPQTAGLILMTQPLIQVFFSYLSGKMSDVYEPGKIATAGIFLCTLGIFTATSITAQTPLYGIYMILVFMGLGFGIFSPANMTVIMGSVRAREYGVASSILATMRTTGMLTSMTIVTVLLGLFLGKGISAESDTEGFVAMMRQTFLIFTILSGAGIFLSMGRIKKRK